MTTTPQLAPQTVRPASAKDHVSADGASAVGQNNKAIIQQLSHSAWRRIALLVVLAVVAAAAFMMIDALDAWEVIARIRIKRLIGLVVVAIALSCSTVVFQAVTRNRILSPSVMGFDAMYSLVATALVFFLGGLRSALIPGPVLFVIHTGFMTVLSVTLFLTLINRHRNSVHLMVLVGIVIGILLRSLTVMMQIIMDPNEFISVMDRTVASFAIINTEALTMTTVVAIGALAFTMWRAPTWDLLYLGPDVATALGVRYRHEVRIALTISSLLVACATALVGPMLFFGLLIVNITVFFVGSSRLTHLIPGAAAFGVTVLVGGQAILEHVFDRATVLPVVLELVGGILLLTLIIRNTRR